MNGLDDRIITVSSEDISGQGERHVLSALVQMVTHACVCDQAHTETDTSGSNKQSRQSEDGKPDRGVTRVPVA
jgi:hypothetical protein